MRLHALYALGIIGLIDTVFANPQSPSRESTTCDKLASTLEGRVYTPDTTQYTESTDSYFALQEANLRPSCIVQPTTAEEVSKAIVVLADAYRDSGEQFAIRSKGHNVNKGIANIQSGVTVDLRRLNSIRISDDKSTVDIQPGPSWTDVYKVLDPFNVTVPGGRAGSVGVGGFLLGGGLSILGPEIGWACDHVLEYEVVLANGEIVIVNENTHADLFTALKGGGNNFGVVTRFTLKTYPHSGILGGMVIYPGDQSSQDIQTYSDIMDSENFDVLADPIAGYGWNASSREQGLLGINIALYSKPAPNPPVYRSFVGDVKPLMDSVRVTKLSEFHDLEQPFGAYNIWRTTSFTHDPRIYPQILKAFNDSIQSVSNDTNVFWAYTVQPSPSLEHSNRNSLGLDPEEERFNILNTAPSYSDPTDGARVQEATQKFVDAVEEITKQAGLYRPFKYANYAGLDQDVLGGCGEAVKERLMAVSRRYDPDGVFQEGVPGGFKLLGQSFDRAGENWPSRNFSIISLSPY